MKKILILAALVLGLSATLVAAGGEETYGAGVTLDEAVAIADLLADPGDYIGQKIRVDGIITGVCKKRGCWVQVSNDKGQGVRIKVEDGVIVFPPDSMGRNAAAEGVFEGVPVAAQEPKHTEKEGAKHVACDSKPQGDMVYFIQGTGAVIQE